MPKIVNKKGVMNTLIVGYLDTNGVYNLKVKLFVSMDAEKDYL